MREDDEDSPSFTGKPFSAVFQQPRTAPRARWRIRGSGGRDGWGLQVQAVVRACEELGITIKEDVEGSPVNVDSFHLEAHFLDGGLSVTTGDYFGERGAWIYGPRAVLLLALQLGLVIRRSWYAANGLERVTFEQLRSELERPQRKRRPRP
jgi:hypothetical protein